MRLAKAAPNDPAHTARAAADLSRVTDGRTDLQTPRTSVRMHSMQPKISEESIWMFKFECISERGFGVLNFWEEFRLRLQESGVWG